jgi:hypothetical protein
MRLPMPVAPAASAPGASPLGGGAEGLAGPLEQATGMLNDSPLGIAEQLGKPLQDFTGAVTQRMQQLTQEVQQVKQQLSTATSQLKNSR